MTKPNIIFLDIDGVLCTPRSFVADGGSHGGKAYDPTGVKLINRLCEECNAEIVVSSVWRGAGSHIVRGELLLMGIRAKFFVDKIDDNNYHNSYDWDSCITPFPIIGFRGDEINKWLEKYGTKINKYVCIDDDGDFHPNQPLVQTDCMNGITFENFVEVKKILNGGE